VPFARTHAAVEVFYTISQQSVDNVLVNIAPDLNQPLFSTST